MEITLVVMAAGMGSRYGGLKQIDGYGPNGETLLEYSVYDAIRAGFDRVVFVIRPDIEDDFNACLPSALTSSIDTHTVFQTYTLGLPKGLTIPVGREKPWGTGQAVLAARDVIPGPFAVINADDFYGEHAFQSMATFLRGLPSAGESVASALVGYRLKHTLSDYGSVSRGLCEVSAYRELLSIEEAPTIKRSKGGIVAVNAEGSSRPLDGDAWVSMNFWGFAPSFWPVLERAFDTFLKTKAQDIKAEF
ncbi:MAG TPA: nucleotidyltransferase, partial [Opitutae bacterium]|nr:nucleotidyltransferase [Opitutae bacterium]